MTAIVKYSRVDFLSGYVRERDGESGGIERERIHILFTQEGNRIGKGFLFCFVFLHLALDLNRWGGGCYCVTTKQRQREGEGEEERNGCFISSPVRFCRDLTTAHVKAFFFK